MDGADIITALRAVLPEDCLLTREEERRPYECDGLTAFRRLPQLVALPRTKRLGAWASLVLLLLVYPANVQMAVDAGKPHDAYSWGVWLRLPLQFPMFAWAYRNTK